MRSPSWFGKLWKRLAGEVVQDVPPSLEQCESCREVDCTQERWESCQHRLATEAVALEQRRREAVASVAAVPARKPEQATGQGAAKPKPVSS